MYRKKKIIPQINMKYALLFLIKYRAIFFQIYIIRYTKIINYIKTVVDCIYLSLI